MIIIPKSCRVQHILSSTLLSFIHCILPTAPSHNQRAYLSVINGNAQEGSRTLPHVNFMGSNLPAPNSGLLLESTTGYKIICIALQRDTKLKRVEPTANFYFS